MDKLQMCRICRAENVRMYVVVDGNLRELYERLTDIPFVTEDSRPILACFVCCAQLKKCYRLWKKCLEAEELFARMMNEDYERKPLINQDQFDLFHGFIKTPIESINIFKADITEQIVVKEELPAICEGLYDIIEPKEEHLSDDDQEKVNYTFTVTDNHLDIEYIAPRRSVSDSEDDVSLMQVKTELEEEPEVSEKKRRADETNSATVAKKPEVVPARTNLEQTITDPEMCQDNPLLKPFISSQLRLQNSLNNATVDIDCSTNSNQDLSVVQDLKPYKCEICQFSFKRKSDMLTHTRTHTGEKPFNCHLCQRSFGRKNNLVKHLRVHTGEKPHKCGICERSFTEKCNLTKHLKVHMGEKPYKCHLCPRSFSQNVNLRNHIQSHTGNKRFKCDRCPSSFCYIGELTKHIRVHTGEKPFKCDICQSCFTQKPNLQRHIRTHT